EVDHAPRRLRRTRDSRALTRTPEGVGRRGATATHSATTITLCGQADVKSSSRWTERTPRPMWECVAQNSRVAQGRATVPCGARIYPPSVPPLVSRKRYSHPPALHI